MSDIDMTAGDQEPLEDLFRRFLKASEARPASPPALEASKPLAEHGSVTARLGSFAGRVADLEAEWNHLVQEHTSTHRNGMAHLRHLKSLIADLESGTGVPEAEQCAAHVDYKPVQDS